MESNVLVTGCTVYGQTATNAVGIYGDGGVEVANNTIYNNYYGVNTYYTNIYVHNNRVYDNISIGIYSDGVGAIASNIVYSNNIGIQADFSFNDHLVNNLVYANTTDGILVTNYSSGNATIANNTVYQVSGSAIRFDGGAKNDKLYNNVVYALAGYDIYVADNSRTGLVSDYNDLYDGGSAAVGFWNRAVNNGLQSQLSNWQSATGQDAHSISADPKFVNTSGNDNLLGYAIVNGVYSDHGGDDNFYLSADSPAIDSGNSWLAPVTDLQNSSRTDDPGTTNHGASDYFPAPVTPQPAYPTGGVAQLWRNVNSYNNYTLPFSFTFYGTAYTTVAVSTSGYLQFAGPDTPSDASSPITKFLRNARIAPLLANIETNQTGDDIYIDKSVGNQITFRWVATSVADGSPVNFAVTLYANGNIQFFYGAGNTNLAPTIGISAGNGFAYQLLSGYSGQSNLTNAASILYTLQPGIVDMGAYEFLGSSLDVTPPAITATSPAYIATSGAGFAFNLLQVTFSEPVSAIDVGSAAVYELREAGTNGFGSVNDVVYSLTPSYNSATNTVTLTVNGLAGGVLPAGQYRLTVFSTSGDTIHDLSGNALDGDGNGTAGGSYVSVFTVTGASPSSLA